MEKKKIRFVVGISVAILILVLNLIGLAYFKKGEKYWELAKSLPSFSEEAELLRDQALAIGDRAHAFQMAALGVELVFVMSMEVLYIRRRKWICKLPNNYEIWHKDEGNIILKKCYQLEIVDVIDDNVAAFCYNERYICVRVGAYEKKSRRKNQKIEVQQDNFEYYIIDTERTNRFGPFTAGQFLWECRTSGVGELPDWIKTDPRPYQAEVL